MKTKSKYAAAFVLAAAIASPAIAGDLATESALGRDSGAAATISPGAAMWNMHLNMHRPATLGDFQLEGRQ
jgi:hypothetical protein